MNNGLGPLDAILYNGKLSTRLESSYKQILTESKDYNLFITI